MEEQQNGYTEVEKVKLFLTLFLNINFEII